MNAAFHVSVPGSDDMWPVCTLSNQTQIVNITPAAAAVVNTEQECGFLNNLLRILLQFFFIRLTLKLAFELWCQ